MTIKSNTKGNRLFLMSSILDNLPFDVWFKAKDGTYSYVNEHAAKEIGKPKDDIIGKTDCELYMDYEASQYSKTDEATFAGKHSGMSHFFIPSLGYRKEFKKLVYDDDGEVAGLIGYSEDITKETETENALKQSELRFRTIFEKAPIGMGLFGTISSNPIQINQRYADATGYTMEQAKKISWEEYTYPDDIEENKANNKLIAEGKLDSYAIEKRFVHPDGKIVWVKLTVTKFDAESGDDSILAMVEDITSRKKAEDEVTYLSYYDALTGLYNRRYYTETLSAIDIEANLPISMIMADVNGLKLTNDAFGHGAGDELLKRTAEVIKKACRDTDIVARIGGDEFVVILPNTGEEDVANIVKRIQEGTYCDADDKLNVIHSVSFGWATKTNDSKDITLVYKQAEDDMYRHKLVEGNRMRRQTIRMITKKMCQNGGTELRHSQMVKKYSVELGCLAGLTGVALMELKTAAFLHDIGKSGFDEVAWGKPEELTDGEWNIIIKHPETGYQILRSSNEFSQIAEYVLYHHERIDGSGYPSGLTGDKIPLQSRIISIAEAFVIMTAGTTHQEAVSRQEAIDTLKRGAGTQFDAALVKLFVENVLHGEEEEVEENKNPKSYHRRRND